MEPIPLTHSPGNPPLQDSFPPFSPTRTLPSEVVADSAKILREVVQKTNQVVGQEFFRSLARGLADALNIEHCFVTQCLDQPPKRVRTLAFWTGNQFAEAYEYNLLATPCEEVLRGTCRTYNSNIQNLFPDDQDLVALKAEGYAGVPLVGSSGEVIGHLVILSTLPFPEPAPDLTLLELFAARAAAELERQLATLELANSEAKLRQAETTLRAIVEGTAGTVGEAFFRSLTRHMAEAFGTQYAVVAELDGEQVRTLAAWGNGGFLDPPVYPLADSPCEQVMSSRSRTFFPDSLQKLFSSHPLISKLGAESYLGTPLLDVDQEPIGLLAVLDERPLGDDLKNNQLLSIFASRATAEIQRKRLEEHRQRLQSQVLHVQKLESLGVLAGGIAHDFNNLLCAIVGNVELATARLEAGLMDRALGHLQEVLVAAKRSTDLTHQMLAYSGHGSFIISNLDLNRVIEEMSDLLRVSISKKAEIELDLDSDLPLFKGDATQIRQVVMNLITNASDAIGEMPGQIRIRTGVCHADRNLLDEAYLAEALPEKAYVFLEVEDDGCGMDEETLERLFDPFFTTKDTGRGLGLAALLGIVRGHRGAVRVRSTPGKGSVFTVLLQPSELETAAAGASKPTSSSKWQGSGKVLLADDEALVRLVMGQMLEHLGFEVELAENGRQAVELFRQHREELRVVILDMMMPELNGLEAFRKIRHLDPDVKVLLASGFSSQSIPEPLDGGGIDGFMQKPVRLDQLRSRLRETLAP